MFTNLYNKCIEKITENRVKINNNLTINICHCIAQFDFSLFQFCCIITMFFFLYHRLEADKF